MESKRIMELDALLTRYLEDKCTEEEKHRILDILGSAENEKLSKEVLFAILDKLQEDSDKVHSVDFEAIYRKILSEISRRESRVSEEQPVVKKIFTRKLLLQGVSVAAVLCITFLMGTLFGPGHSKPETAAAEIQPATITVKAPLGSHSEITLADGTEVLLNAGSLLKYKNDYNDLNRDLIMEGEAYFKVARNADLPLVVNAGNINIRATGTEFNVKAYSEEGIIETTLVDGEVEISHKGDNDKGKVLVLKPHQKAIYAQQSDMLTLERIKEIEPQAVRTTKIKTANLLVSAATDVEQATAWTQNKLIIRSENLESLCTKLQRKYNVTFVFSSNEIKKHHFSGVLLDETLQQVLDVIKLTAPVDYFVDRKTVLLFPRKEQP